MNQSPTNYWITLRLAARPGSLWAAYEDSSGFRQKPPRVLSGDPEDWSLRGLPLHLSQSIPVDLQPQIDGVFLPSDFDDRLRVMLNAMPPYRNQPFDPLPLAIFVAGPDGAQIFDWEGGIEALLAPDIDRERIQVVRLVRERWSTRPPFRLPIRLLGSGDRFLPALDMLRGSSWFQNSPAVQKYGLHIDYVEPAKLSTTLRSATYDIVLVDESGIEVALQTSSHLRKPNETRPRLIVFVDYQDDSLFSASLTLPPGMSLLKVPLLPLADPGPFLKELTLALIHDNPLHEAAKSVMRSVSQDLVHPVTLFADPLSNHYLRMADALEQLRDEAFEVGALVTPGNIDAFLARVSKTSGAKAGKSLERHLRTAAAKRDSAFENALNFSQQPDVGFEMESAGLVPMAALTAELDARITDARAASDAIASSLENIAADAELASYVEASQDRRVEITMDHLQEDDIYSRLSPEYDVLTVGNIYRLNVFVGHRLPDSLLINEPPPLDPLLPEPEGETGHMLEVAVFEKDFKILSPRVQTLYLPRLGGSRPVKIECQAPDEAGPAELRISIYYKNYLLQSFLLTANVQSGWGVGFDERQVKVDLDFSRTARFTNLTELGPRLLSIGSNQDGDGRTHSFLLKKDKTATQPIKMTEAVANNQIARFRSIVELAAEDYGHFEPDLSGRPKRRDQQAFETVIRDLADLGRDLYHFLFVHSPKEMKNQLRQVKKVSDEIIQITRHDPGFVFPWPVIYDYQLPKKVLGAPPARVCMGRPFSDAPSEPRQGRGCPHNPHEEVYCVEGFWGIRHRLEQLIGQGDALRDAVNVVDRPLAREGICLATGLSDKFSDRLVASLRQKLQDDFATLETQDELFDRLWEPEKRPAIFILLSQLETTDKVGQPVGPRMLLSPQPTTNGGAASTREIWLQAADITDQSIEAGEWDDQPRTLVLLMACNSAASAVDTLNNYLTSLTSVGASAIVGTETSVLSDLVALFAEQVTLSLWLENTTLGEAIQSFNRRMIASYNPLAFVFNCFGSADIKLTSST